MELFHDTDLAQTKTISESTSKMLIALADIGCSKHVIAPFLEMDRAHKDHIRFLTGPIIQHTSPWASSTPSWLYEAITADRLRIILDEHGQQKPGWQVGPAELTAVIYPATMDAPLPREYSEIYLWAGAYANARHQNKTPDQIWKQVGGEPIPDNWITSSGGRYFNEYRQLCTDIRRRVINAATARSRKPPSPHVSEKQIEITTEQLSFF